MKPNMEMLFDELAQLNRRFDEQDERWTRRFTGLEQSISERSTATIRRIDALEGLALLRRQRPLSTRG